MDKKYSYVKIVIVGQLLWYNRNKTFHDVVLFENNQLWGGKSKAASRQAASHNPAADYFPNLIVYNIVFCFFLHNT